MRYILRTIGTDSDAPWVPEEYLSRYPAVDRANLQPWDTEIYPGWATMYAGNDQLLTSNKMEGLVTHTPDERRRRAAGHSASLLTVRCRKRGGPSRGAVSTTAASGEGIPSPDMFPPPMRRATHHVCVFVALPPDIILPSDLLLVLRPHEGQPSRKASSGPRNMRKPRLLA